MMVVLARGKKLGLVRCCSRVEASGLRVCCRFINKFILWTAKGLRKNISTRRVS